MKNDSKDVSAKSLSSTFFFLAANQHIRMISEGSCELGYFS